MRDFFFRIMQLDNILNIELYNLMYNTTMDSQSRFTTLVLSNQGYHETGTVHPDCPPESPRLATRISVDTLVQHLGQATSFRSTSSFSNRKPLRPPVLMRVIWSPLTVTSKRVGGLFSSAVLYLCSEHVFSVLVIPPSGGEE